MKKGKRYLGIKSQIDNTKLYEVEEGIKLLTDTAKAKFDESVELHIRLGVDGRNADQQVRGVVVLPNGTGKKVKVLVFLGAVIFIKVLIRVFTYLLRNQKFSLTHYW